ncbi:MAG: Holliday junction endonuclease [Planctomycetes bacterium]|nr:Holliday junction endonuclease [Planctomycetota bacterium]
MNYLGCDPGLDGGLAALTPEGLVLRVMPAVAVGKRRQLDEQAIVQWLMQFQPASTRVFIEAVGARPKQGVVAMFSFGTGWGLVRGVCAGLGLPYELVRPQEWQGEVLKGQPPGSEYLVASRLWPNAEWRASERSSKPHDGLVDAALLAEYGRRRSP